MSGICGIVRLYGQPVDERDLHRQMAALERLGPDRRRLWCDGSAGLGSLLMRTSNEDVFDAQPLRESASGLAFVSDARIDNREEVAQALAISATALAGMADSALMFAAYQAWGDSCAERLIGDFVFAVWNSHARTLTLGRDHMGQRHLFFHVGDGFFAFATERKGLWALPEVPRRLPMDRVFRRLVQGASASKPAAFIASPADGLAAVRGGTVVTLAADGTVSERQYWSPHAAPEHLNRDEAYYVEAYRRVLGEAVACRLRRANAPVSLLFGGGFDSGAIAALAGPVLSPVGRKLIAPAGVSAKEGSRGDARRWIEVCRRHMPHLDIHYVTRERPDGLDGLEKSFLLSDTPHSENRFMGDALFAASKAAGSRIIMDGNGGDYTINPRGNGFFIDMLLKRRFSKIASEWQARRRTQGVSHWTMFRNEILLYGAPSLARPWSRWRNGLSPFGSISPVAAKLLRQAGERGILAPRPRRYSIREAMVWVLEEQRRAPTVGWSATATAHQLEFTEPFHDKRVVELGLAIPEEYLLVAGRERHLARQALKDLSPPEFQTRRDGNDAMQPDFMDMADRLRPQILAEIDRMEQAGQLSAYFDFAKMRRMLNRTRPGTGRPYEYPTRNAMSAFIWGRYIEWFQGNNS